MPDKECSKPSEQGTHKLPFLVGTATISISLTSQGKSGLSPTVGGGEKKNRELYGFCICSGRTFSQQ